MTFHPAHMQAGIKAAIASPKTPVHLKAHLQKRLAGAMPMKPPTPKKMMSGPMMAGQMPARNGSLMPVVPKVKKGKIAAKKTKPVNTAKPLLPAEFYGQR